MVTMSQRLLSYTKRVLADFKDTMQRGRGVIQIRHRLQKRRTKIPQRLLNAGVHFSRFGQTGTF